MSHFPKPWKEAEILTLPKAGKYPTFSKHLPPISLLSTAGKLFDIAEHCQYCNLPDPWRNIHP
jgi:hypothetical protein